MTFPAQLNLSDYWTRIRGAAASVKQQAQSASVMAAGPGINAATILDFTTRLADARTAMLASVVPGIVAYAQDQLNDNTIDITAEFNTVTTNIQNVVNWVLTNFPKDGSGFLLAVTFLGDNSGRTVPRLFTSSDLAPFKVLVDTLDASIRVV